MDLPQNITSFKSLEAVIDKITASDMILDETYIDSLSNTFFALSLLLTKKEQRLGQNDVLYTRKLDDDVDNIVEESICRATCAEKILNVNGLSPQNRLTIQKLVPKFKEMAELTKQSTETKKQMLSILNKAGLSTKPETGNSGCMLVFLIMIIISGLTLI